MKLEYIDIIEAIQYSVDKIVKVKYKEDTSTPPKFIVSLLDRSDKEGKLINHEIALTVSHAGFIHTRTIFPQVQYKYGYEPLEREIEWLYNSTM